MANTTIAFGAALILLGLASYVLTEGVSVTALIPAFFGVPLLLAGVLARNERYRMHSMHAAAALGLLGFLGSAPGLIALLTLASGGQVARPAAVIAQSIMAILMATFVALCVKSFREARRQRAASR